MSRVNDLEDALREALDLVEDYANYVSPFLLHKWGHQEDFDRLTKVLDER